MLELPLLADRSARRVYQTLAWLHVRRPDADRQALRDLRAQAFRLGLRADAAREVEAVAREASSIRVGRDPEERAWLEVTLGDLVQRARQAGAAEAVIQALKAKADGLLRSASRKVRETPSPGSCSRRSAIEVSEEGPPVSAVDTSKIPLIVPQRAAPRQAS
jgi:hypothetical protein